MTNSRVKTFIEKCAHESRAGLLTFPEVLTCLIDVGVESYFVDYRDQSTTYYLSNNQSVRISIEMPPIEIPIQFNESSVISAIRGAQTDVIRYPEFLRLTMSAGCIGYLVWITGRHVSYFGRNGQGHVEHFP